MRLVFWKNKKIDSDNVLASCNNSKWHPTLRYYCLNVSQLVCNRRKRATRCSQSDWLVSVDGVNECISNMVRTSGKTNTFLICYKRLDAWKTFTVFMWIALRKARISSIKSAMRADLLFVFHEGGPVLYGGKWS